MLTHHGLADSARRSELCLVPRLGLQEASLLLQLLFRALRAAGHVGQGVGADEIPVEGWRALASRLPRRPG